MVALQSSQEGIDCDAGDRAEEDSRGIYPTQVAFEWMFHPGHSNQLAVHGRVEFKPMNNKANAHHSKKKHGLVIL
ncbi:hypothetical protein ACLOJK_005034 [Asimina triloba]